MEFVYLVLENANLDGKIAFNFYRGILFLFGMHENLKIKPDLNLNREFQNKSEIENKLLWLGFIQINFLDIMRCRSEVLKYTYIQICRDTKILARFNSSQTLSTRNALFELTIKYSHNILP